MTDDKKITFISALNELKILKSINEVLIRANVKTINQIENENVINLSKEEIKTLIRVNKSLKNSIRKLNLIKGELVNE